MLSSKSFSTLFRDLAVMLFSHWPSSGLFYHTAWQVTDIAGELCFPDKFDVNSVTESTTTFLLLHFFSTLLNHERSRRKKVSHMMLFILTRNCVVWAQSCAATKERIEDGKILRETANQQHIAKSKSCGRQPKAADSAQTGGKVFSSARVLRWLGFKVEHFNTLF